MTFRAVCGILHLQAPFPAGAVFFPRRYAASRRTHSTASDAAERSSAGKITRRTLHRIQREKNAGCFAGRFAAAQRGSKAAMRYPAGLQNAGKEFGICAARWRCRAAFVLGNRKYGFDHIPPEAGNDSQMPGQMHESRLECGRYLMIRRLQKPFIGGKSSRSFPIFRRFWRKRCEKRLFSTAYPQSSPQMGDNTTQ